MAAYSIPTTQSSPSTAVCAVQAAAPHPRSTAILVLLHALPGRLLTCFGNPFRPHSRFGDKLLEIGLRYSFVYSALFVVEGIL